MADQYLYEETLENGAPAPEPFVNKECLYVLDQNGGSYNGQVQFDTSTLANSGKWLSFSEGYLQVPFIMTFRSSADLTHGDANDYVNGFMLGLKNGTHHLIDSIQVDYNNTNIVQLQPFTNFHIGYKLMSSFSRDDLIKYGSSLLFSPDNAGSSSYSAGASANGDGTSNNVVNPIQAITYGTQLENTNTGFLKRLQNTSYSLITGRLGYGGNTEINTVALANQVGKNYVNINGAGLAAAAVWQWNILATIRLKDVADFFNKMPLVKGASLRIVLNYNSCRQTLTSVAAGPTLITTSTTFTSGRTNPMMVASSAANNPSNVAVAQGGGAVFSIACGIGQNSVSNAFQQAQISSCRLYVPSYELNPSYEANLLSVRPRREVVYNDIYNYNVLSVAAGASFNSILTNGIVGAQKLIVIPVLSGANSGVAGNISPYQSCFDTCPATTAPLAAITQFNAQVGGKNLFQQNFQYDFENFMNEVVSMNSINGAKSTGLMSGLISSYDWDNLYRYYVIDLSRRLPADDKIPRSLSIQGINNTSKTIDYICFIEFSRKIIIDTLTGAIVDN
jgi:hypothetical protein